MSKTSAHRDRPESRTDPFDRLAEVDPGTPCVLLHDCGTGAPTRAPAGRYGWAAPSPRARFPGGAMLFRSPVAVLEIGPEEILQDGEAAFLRIDRFLDEHREHHVAGALGFDLRDAIERIPRTIADDFEVPVVHLQAHREIEWCERAPAPGGGAPPATGSPRPLPILEAAAYQDLVARTVEHIRRGDIFQANLTQPFDGRFDGDPRQLFRRLCAVSPAPFAAYVQTGSGVSVLSSSPEEFLHVEGRIARTRPIKGTRPRAADPELDEHLRRELFDSRKDRAELAMIVDLLRNDLGKVSEIGSVRWGDFPEQASFAQVHHLFCTVTSELRPEVTAGELLRAAFPCGSITGAPKLRCMEILEDLEVVRRGFYTGSIGWFGPGTDLHLNVAIRTVTWKGGRVRFNVGGGVTADSDPVAEWQETWDKAAGMLRALGGDEAPTDRAGGDAAAPGEARPG